MTRLPRLAAMFSALSLALPAAAEDMALVISNSGTLFGGVEERSAEEHAAVVALAREKGYRVVEGQDLDGAALRELIADFAADVAAEAGDDLVLVYYAGRAVTVGGQTVLEPVDGTAADPAAMLLEGVPAAALTSLGLGRPEGRTAVFVGYNARDRKRHADFAERAIRIEAPEGTLLVHGFVRRVRAALVEDALTLGRSAAELAAAGGALTVTGPNSADVTLVPEASRTDLLEQTLWTVASGSDRPELLRIYLERFPNGIYAEEARRRLGSGNPAADAEAALELDEAARRDVQGDLVVLGYDTGGIDGIFGPATRSAISTFQERAGREATGYLTEEDVTEINRAAREARRERREAREARAAEDDAYWRQTGASGERADLRAYLDRYPNGRHAAEARAALAELRGGDAPQASAEERRAWRRARRADTEAAYAEYIATYPDGAFRAEAEERLFATRQGGDRRAAEEQALGLSEGSLRLVEVRLQSLGHEPGAADGRITNDTRRAIRQFQRSAGLEATGYLDRATLRELLAS